MTVTLNSGTLGAKIDVPFFECGIRVLWEAGFLNINTIDTGTRQFLVMDCAVSDVKRTPRPSPSRRHWHSPLQSCANC